MAWRSAWPRRVLSAGFIQRSSSGVDRGGDHGSWCARNVAARPADRSPTAWLPSRGRRRTDCCVSEVVTGAGTASDEFVEIYNASATDRDLGGLELVYATASGSTVTRKQTWTQLTIGSHRHLLLANSAGKWAAGADGLYSSGFAATGGSLVLRTLGGTCRRLAQLGRCRQRVRGGRRGACAGRGIQPRAQARWARRQRDRHERQPGRYPGRGQPATSVTGLRPCAG